LFDFCRGSRRLHLRGRLLLFDEHSRGRRGLSRRGRRRLEPVQRLTGGLVLRVERQRPAQAVDALLGVFQGKPQTQPAFLGVWICLDKPGEVSRGCFSVTGAEGGLVCLEEVGVGQE